MRRDEPPARWSRRAACLAGLALAWTADRDAVAASPCRVAAAIGELGADEQRTLTRTCEGAPTDERALHAAVFHVVSLAGWRSGALADLLAPLRGQGPRVLRGRDDAAPPDLVRAQARLAARAEALAGPACADLRRAVETFEAATRRGEPAASPFLRDDPALARCLGVDGAAFDGLRLIAFRADGVESLFVAAAAPEFSAWTWLAPADALVFGRQRWFVVAAPPGAPMTAVARLANAEVPALWRGIVRHDEVAWPEPPPMTCVHLDVRLGPAATLLLDGTPVIRDAGGLSRVVTLTRQDHELVALECLREGAACHVRYRETIPAAVLQRPTNQCLDVRLDLAARPRPAVALLGATQGEACGAAPLRVDGLRQAAADRLSFGPSRTTHEFRDLAAFAAATDALSTLRSRLHAGAGAATGPATGADGSDLLGSAAKEAWRQGIDLLLSLDLQCVRRGEGWRYRLTATRVALGSMFSRGRHSGRSLDLGSFLETVTEEFADDDHLAVALAGVVDRSLGAPYLRLLVDAGAHPYRDGAAVTVQRFAGDACEAACPARDGAACRRACAARTVGVQARRLALGGPPPPVCARLSRTLDPDPELLAAARQAFADGGGPPIDLTVADDQDGDRYAARLRGPVPGWYVLLARWSDEHAPRAATCVELTASRRRPARRHEIWGDIAVSMADLILAPRSSPQTFYARTRIGYVHYPRPIVGVGAVVGYAYTGYEWQNGRPAWQDFDVADLGPLAWRRHALLVGGLVEVRTRFARLPVDLRLRAAPTLSLGLLDLRRIPAGMSRFVGTFEGTPTEFDVDLDVHFDAVVGYEVGRVALQHVLLLGLHAIDDPVRWAPNNVRDSGGFFIGLGLGIGGAQ